VGLFRGWILPGRGEPTRGTVSRNSESWLMQTSRKNRCALRTVLETAFETVSGSEPLFVQRSEQL